MAQPVFSLSRHTRHELFEAIIQSLNRMPERLRRVFVWSHYQGKSRTDIAEKLGLKEDQVTTLLTEANLRFFDSVRRLRMSR